ncbi:hypothetical protein MPSEU_000189400 [Mayamaea pseudoterrestris]|nr:hypothetical protein MPSEU_000189400 [Mayamaea pseudoterrestris]
MKRSHHDDRRINRHSNSGKAMYSYPQHQTNHNNHMQQQQQYRSDNGPRTKCDQVVFEAIAKACEIIVTSRCPSIETNNNTANNTTSRFNLQLPELSGVRNILQTTKAGGGALHVPLRLDVYYPHDSQRRELLERWCLEYSVCGMDRFLTREGTVTQDPIAQLRLVCKRIVIWLRTLCCSTCLLPSQVFSQRSQAASLGFSLYMVSDALDDVSDLVQTQGFRMQEPSSSVVTPYGELNWRVYHAPQRTVDALLPTRSTANVVSFRQATASIPIHQRVDERKHRELQRRNTTNLEDETASKKHMVPQSAPEYGGMANYPPSRFGTTFDPSRHHQVASNQHQQQQQQQQQQVHRQSYPVQEQGQPQQHQQDQQRALLQRRHTVLGAHASSSPVSSQTVPVNPPERVLSGLSLMMMMNDEGREQNEMRRAALHQMPPHLIEQASKAANTPTNATTTTAAGPTSKQGEYGYAYNNHIPWQAIHPSQTKPTTFERSPSDVSAAEATSSGMRPISASPQHRHSPWLSGATPLASTPPGEAFLGGTASPPFLMPPRNLMSTPPFQPRPVAFLQQQQQQQQQQHTHADGQTVSRTPEQKHAKTLTGDKYDYEKVVPPITSLDLLHSSPFQTHRHVQGSMMASLSLGANANSLLPLDFRLGGASAHSMLFSTALAPQTEDYLSEDMPFAVDATSSNYTHNKSGGSTSGGHASHPHHANLDESASVASFAHQLKSTNRLQLFESTTQPKPGDLADSLADQLAAFRTFGESLHLSAREKTSPAGSVSSSTPISMRS